MSRSLACVALVAATACASSGSFETGRVHARGDGAVMIGAGVGWQTGERATSAAPDETTRWQIPWLPLHLDLFARVVFGVGGRSEADVTLTSPFWLGPHSPMSVGLSGGLKTSLYGADDGPASVALGARVGADVMTAMTTNQHRLWAQARTTASWHPSDANAGYATPFVLAEWGRWQGRDADGVDHRGAATALSYGLNAGWMRRGAGDRVYYGELGGLWTPRRGVLGAVRGACANCGDGEASDAP